MEALAVILEPYKGLVGAIAGIVTMGQMFSGSFICWDMYKTGSTNGMGVMPFAGGLIIGIVNMKYGSILRDNTMMLVNIFGLMLSCIYLSIYHHYSTEKSKVRSQIGAAAAFGATLVLYASYEDPDKVVARLGSIITVFMFCMISAPLFELKQIIKNKSTAGLPFPLILSGSMVSMLWLLYGIILRNQFIIFQNTIAFILVASQLSLFVIFPSKPSKSPGADKKLQKAD